MLVDTQELRVPGDFFLKQELPKADFHLLTKQCFINFIFFFSRSEVLFILKHREHIAAVSYLLGMGIYS